NWKPEHGTRFSTTDVESGAKVIMLGQTVVEKLFGPNADPVGQIVRVKNTPFQIVAVMTRKGQSPFGTDYDDSAFIPVSTYQAKVQGGLRNYVTGWIYAGSDSAAGIARAEREITNLLRDRHHIELGAEDDFSIRNLTEMASAQQEGTKVLTT